MDILFYQFNKISNIIVIYIVLTLAIGIILYYKVKKFKGTEKEIRLYGMLMGMNHMDIIILAMEEIQLITFCYAAIIKDVDVKLYGIMLAITSIVFVLYRFRSILFEAINYIGCVIAIYLNKTLYQYRTQVEDNSIIKLLQTVLITFMILYGIYVFLNHLDGIIKKNKNVRRNKSEKK